MKKSTFHQRVDDQIGWYDIRQPKPKNALPDRLHDYIQSGSAVWGDWANFIQSIQGVQQYI